MGLDRPYLERLTGEILGEIGALLPLLKRKASEVINPGHIGRVPRGMVEAARAVDGHTLTPMAAVAGAVSDALKKYLVAAGADFVSVNNGGDVSLYSAALRPLRIGISDVERGRDSPYVLVVRDLGDFGVATSGFGGRSLTLGLADMVTVVARTGALADAAATYIGNMTNTDARHVIRRKARDIDPVTDIPEEWVTVAVGDLSGREIRDALGRGVEAAEGLRKAGIIIGAVIQLRGSMVSTVERDGHIILEVFDGSSKNRDDR